MAWSATNLSADEQALYTADKPIFIGQNAVRFYSAVPQWRQGGSWASGSDQTDASYPTYFGYDRYAHLRTKPSSAFSSVTNYIMDLDEAHDFDMFCLIGHNLAGISGSISIAISDTNDFAVSTTICTTSGGPAITGQRVAMWTLNGSGGATPQRFSGVKYARMRLALGSLFIPEFGELWLGRRRQLRYAQEEPYDRTSLRASVTTRTSRSGVTSAYLNWRVRREIAPTFLINSADQDTVTNFWHEAGAGSSSFLFAEKPSSLPWNVHLMRTRAGDIDYQDLPGFPTTRAWTVDMVEQAPFLRTEAVY